VKRRLASVLLLAGLSSGCGYALVGKGVTTDASIKRIGVPMFKDATGRAGLDQKVTQRVVEELLRRGRFDVVPDAQGVDAVVEGELVGYHAVPVGFSGEDAGRTQASRYSITLTARVRYTKVGAAEPLWSSDSFSFRDEYEVGSDPNIYFDREEPSMDRLTTAFARNLVAAMLEAF
jgi:hypothetical protein